MFRRRPERAPQDLRCETGAAHPAEHYPIELRAHLVGEGPQCLHLLRHRLAHREPPQPISDLGRARVVLPHRRVASPDPPGELGGFDEGDPPGDGGIDDGEYRRMTGRRLGGERLALVPDHAEHCLE